MSSNHLGKFNIIIVDEADFIVSRNTLNVVPVEQGRIQINGIFYPHKTHTKILMFSATYSDHTRTLL